jgi:hypothetical protein
MTPAILLISLSLVGAPEPPRGKEIEELIAKGVQLRETRKDAEALDLFRKAYELSQGVHSRSWPSPNRPSGVGSMPRHT